MKNQTKITQYGKKMKPVEEDMGEDKTTEGTFVWTDGTSFTFTNWKDGQPGGGTVQNCLQMRFTDGLWDDMKCSKDTNVYICKK